MTEPKERYLKVYINQHVDTTMRQFAIITCNLIDPKGDIFFGSTNHEVAVSFNLEYFMTEVAEEHRAWFIAHVVRNIADPVAAENGWEITEEENSYVELLRICENLWEDYQKNIDKYK
jgi:hypothetical protein